ncbi:MAG: aspartate aminotransferase family protein [Deltaproteobacteria bacterium]|nr:MAG: aspartate aminotransferase family protein [Deltaproteobacteria bacterium]
MGKQEDKEKVLEKFSRFVNAGNVAAMNIVGLGIVEARREGAWVWDADGTKYLDCFSSAGSFNVGRRNPEIIKALKNAIEELDLGIFLFPSRPKAELAEKLAEITPGDLSCTTYGTGGGEANDCAIKLARGYTQRPKIVATEKGYHGHVGFSLSAIGREHYRDPFGPLMPDFEHVPFGDIEAAEAVVDDTTAAVILEPIQGEGGINVAPYDYIKGLRKLCDERGALLIIDEIQTGFGRTGKMFCSEHYEVAPDIMTVAKSLGGALYPISATITTPKINTFWESHPFIHLSTFGGSDIGCRVALAVIDFIEKNGLAENAARMGEKLLNGLGALKDKHPGVFEEVRGKGLMIGLKYVRDDHGMLMSMNLAKEGVIAIFTANEPSVMRLMPPLIIGEEEVELILNAMDKAMAKIED